MTIHLNIPQSWNDLTLSQAMNAYHVIMADRGWELFEPHEIMPGRRIMLFSRLSGITDEQYTAWRESFDDTDGPAKLQFLTELNTALESINFLFDIHEPEAEDEPTTYAIKLALTRCPWPELKRDGKKSWFAPADGIASMSFLELVTVFGLFERYIQDYDDDTLHTLLAVLYRPHKPRTKENRRTGYQGDIRMPYLGHESTVASRAAKMARVPVPCKQLMLFWFASIRQQCIDQFPDLFTPQDSTANPSKYGWAGVLMAMSGGLQHLDAVAAQPAEDALTYLDYLNEQAKEQERKRKNARANAH